jgi:hypothetical protein
MSFSIGMFGEAVHVQDEMVIGWEEITSRPTLAEAFVAGENALPAAWAHDDLVWTRISPGLWMLASDGDITGILIKEDR